MVGLYFSMLQHIHSNAYYDTVSTRKSLKQQQRYYRCRLYEKMLDR